MAVAKKTTEEGGRASGKAPVHRNSTKKTASSKTKSAAKSEETKKNNLEKLIEFKDHQAFETGIIIVVMGIISFLLYLSYFSLAD